MGTADASVGYQGLQPCERFQLGVQSVNACGLGLATIDGHEQRLREHSAGVHSPRQKHELLAHSSDDQIMLPSRYGQSDKHGCSVARMEQFRLVVPYGQSLTAFDLQSACVVVAFELALVLCSTWKGAQLGGGAVDSGPCLPWLLVSYLSRVNYLPEVRAIESCAEAAYCAQVEFLRVGARKIDFPLRCFLCRHGAMPAWTCTKRVIVSLLRYGGRATRIRISGPTYRVTRE